MLNQALLRAITQTIVPLAMITGACAHEEGRFPNLRGQWDRFIVRSVAGAPSFDQTKPEGAGQKAPLTPEYKEIFGASLADQAAGGHGGAVDHARCVASGMPFMMIAFRPLEFVITAETTYIIIADYDPVRRVFTDGRSWPDEIEPTYQGYSIGQWIDEDGDGKYDVLEVETRGFKGPRVYDLTGLPLHHDNQSVFKERIFLDKQNPNLLYDEVTVIDNALTRPWVVTKRYVRNPDLRAAWPESSCSENNAYVFVGKEYYFVSADGLLMPAKKGRQPPDLRYFKQPRH